MWLHEGVASYFEDLPYDTVWGMPAVRFQTASAVSPTLEVCKVLPNFYLQTTVRCRTATMLANKASSIYSLKKPLKVKSNRR